MKPRSILETVLYNADLETGQWFYSTVLGLDLVGAGSDLMFVCRVDADHLLLVFDPRESDKPGRDVPSHGARGPGHVALRIGESEYDGWIARFSSFGVPIEQEIEWSGDSWRQPGRSIYVRDPYGNSVELITSDIWPDEAAPET